MRPLRPFLRSVALSSLLVPVLGFGAAETTLGGRVFDMTTALYVEGATVSLTATGRSVATDASGQFVFTDIDLRIPDTLVIEHPDYRTLRLPLGAIEDEEWILRVGLDPVASEATPGEIDP